MPISKKNINIMIYKIYYTTIKNNLIRPGTILKLKNNGKWKLESSNHYIYIEEQTVMRWIKLKFLSPYKPVENKDNFNIIKIIEVICSYLNIPIEAIQTKSSKKELVEAKQIIIFLAREKTKLSLKTIGNYIGNKDHSTVSYTYKKVKRLYELKRKIKKHIDNIENSLKISKI